MMDPVLLPRLSTTQRTSQHTAEVDVRYIYLKLYLFRLFGDILTSGSTNNFLMPAPNAKENVEPMIKMSG